MRKYDSSVSNAIEMSLTYKSLPYSQSFREFFVVKCHLNIILLLQFTLAKKKHTEMNKTSKNLFDTEFLFLYKNLLLITIS